MPLPFLTTELPGVGGRIRQACEDFRVEEIPLYPASGEGPTLWGPRYHPMRRGFDEFFGFLHEGHYYASPWWKGVTI